jgi:tripartite-type tricarboxylate transporter receptor subunit TctC
MIVSRLRTATLALCAAVACVAAASVAEADEPFYKGKRLTLLVNYAAGGPTDVEARLLARHLPKHIDGQPTIIVQNMEGGGGLIASNYLAEVAPKDGTVVGYLTGATWRYITDPERYRVDFKTYEFVGYQPGTTVYFMRADVPPGMKEPTDIAKAQGLVAGGLNADNSKDLLIRLTLDMLGVPYKYVTGYVSSQSARLALQRGEIHFYSESPPSYRGVIEPTLVKKGEVIPLFYNEGYDGETFWVPKQVEGTPLLPFSDLYKKIKGKEPSGQLWEAYLSIISTNAAMQRMIAFAPGVPQPAVDALRMALLKLEGDSAFAEDATKAIGFVPDFKAGPNTNKEVRQALSVRPETKAFLADYVKSAKK